MNQRKIRNISLEEILYYLMLSILLFIKGIGLDEGNLFFRLCLVIAMGLFALKILVGKYTLLELTVIAIGGLWGIFIFFNMGSFGILIYMLMLLGMKNIPVEQVMKVGLAVWSVCMIFTLTAGIFFERFGVRVVHEKLGLGPLLRESLGYGHPNVLHITYILLMSFVLYRCKKENTGKTFILLLAGNLFVFLYSMSYTGLMISAVLLAAYLYFIYREKRTRVENILIQAILPVCIFITVIVAPSLDVNGAIYRILNSLLNNRIFIIKVFFDQFSLTAFGERIYHGNLSLDNSYLYALGWYGVVFFVVAMTVYWLLVRSCLKNDRRRELMIICAFLIGGLTEQFLFNGSIKNITVIFIGEIFYQFSKGKGKEINFFSRYNRSLWMDTSRIEKIFITIKNLPWKKIAVAYMLINVVIAGIILMLPEKEQDAVYVNTKNCHYYAETVRSDEIVETKNTIVIGDRSEGEQFHYFTRENSNLIQFSGFRYRISLSIYISVLIIILYIVAWHFLKGHRHNKMQ